VRRASAAEPERPGDRRHALGGASARLRAAAGAARAATEPGRRAAGATAAGVSADDRRQAGGGECAAAGAARRSRVGPRLRSGDDRRARAIRRLPAEDDSHRRRRGARGEHAGQREHGARRGAGRVHSGDRFAGGAPLRRGRAPAHLFREPGSGTVALRRFADAPAEPAVGRVELLPGEGDGTLRPHRIEQRIAAVSRRPPRGTRMAAQVLKRGQAIVWVPPRSIGERQFATGPVLLAMLPAAASERAGGASAVAGQGVTVFGSASAARYVRVSLDALPALKQVTLVFDARDVNLLHVTLPPLSGVRLRQALPNLVEELLL